MLTLVGNRSLSKMPDSVIKNKFALSNLVLAQLWGRLFAGEPIQYLPFDFRQRQEYIILA